jgi:iron(III) transport system substrate-binding protein
MYMFRHRALPRWWPGVVLGAALALAACGGGGVAPAATGGSAPAANAKTGGTVHVYTSMPQNLIDDMKGDFQAKHAGYALDVYRAATGDLMSKLQAEQRAKAVGADVIWVADESSMLEIKKMQLLQPYDSPELKGIPAALQDPDHVYYAGRVINMVVGYNTKLVTSKPTSFTDLLDPKWKGKVGLPSPAKSGAALVAVGTLVHDSQFGWDYFKKMRANGGVQLSSNEDAASRVSSGELALAIDLDYVIRGMADKGSPIDSVVPKEGMIEVASPLGLVKDAKDAGAARVFIDYVLGPEGQSYLAKQKVVPVRSDVPTPSDVPNLRDLKAMPTDIQYITANTPEILKNFQEIFGS